MQHKGVEFARHQRLQALYRLLVADHLDGLQQNRILGMKSRRRHANEEQKENQEITIQGLFLPFLIDVFWGCFLGIGLHLALQLAVFVGGFLFE